MQLLVNWSKENAKQVVLVSGDSDWGGIQSPSLEVLNNVAKFLYRFPDPIVANKVRRALMDSSRFVDAVREAFENTPFYDPEYKADIVDVEADDIECGEIYVISINDGVATVEADVEISFMATVRGQRPRRSWFYDEYAEDGNWIQTRMSLDKRQRPRLKSLRSRRS